MRILYRDHFKKSYKKRFLHNDKLVRLITSKINQFATNPLDPQLRTHALTGGMKGFYSFSITGDIRIIYQIIDEVAYFYDIGSHNQVY
jgi:addiction module RelE/StbE family toxin